MRNLALNIQTFLPNGNFFIKNHFYKIPKNISKVLLTQKDLKYFENFTTYENFYIRIG